MVQELKSVSHCRSRADASMADAASWPLHARVPQVGYPCRYAQLQLCCQVDSSHLPCSISERFGFRHRSETADIAIELSLQPWKAFKPDGVIMFSDILTPLPALGIEFDVIPKHGPKIETPIRRYVQLLCLQAGVH